MTQSIEWHEADGVLTPADIDEHGIGVVHMISGEDPFAIQQRYRELQCMTPVPHDMHIWNYAPEFASAVDTTVTYWCNGIKELDVPTESKPNEYEVMIREIHGWLSELMPLAREAATMMEKRNKLLSWGRSSGK